MVTGFIFVVQSISRSYFKCFGSFRNQNDHPLSILQANVYELSIVFKTEYHLIFYNVVRIDKIVDIIF